MFSKRNAPSARDSGFDVLQHEMAGEAAAALGRIGTRMEAALAALRAFDTGEDRSQPRDALVKAAAKATWMFFVQRESLGLRDQRPVIAHHQIPREVLLRLGAS